MRTCLYIAAIIGFYCGPIFAQVQSPAPALPSPSAHSENPSFWSKIDTHWGGRLKTTGRITQTDDDTIFEPVGTGTYGDGSFNFRLINETFFSDSVFTDIAYQLIGSGGDTVRKINELEEMFPNLPANFFSFGTPLDDDRRLMDLTDTIADEDSYFMIQRLDRLYLAWMPQWGSIKIGRQAITWVITSVNFCVISDNYPQVKW